MTEKPEKFDFKEIAEEAVKNEPSRSVDAATVQALQVEQKSPEKIEEKTGFEANAYDLVPAIIEALGIGWRRMWGIGEGAELSAKEKDGLQSLLQRGCEHFGLIAYVRGTRGFFIALAVKLVGIVLPRATKETPRKHFMAWFNGKQEEKTDGTKSSGTGSAGEPAQAAAQSNG